MTTSATTPVTDTGPTVNGGVDPNGQATTAWFEYGPDGNLATLTLAADQAIGFGNTFR